MKTGCSALVLSLFAAACGDGGDWESGGAVGTEREEITGGKLVPKETGSPDTSVVKLEVRQTGGTEVCSGIKVDANTFWTAGSCIERAVAGDHVLVTNSLDENLDGSVTYETTVLSVDVHPSRKNFARQWPSGPQHYDVGRLQLAGDTPDIPAYSTTHPYWMAPNQTVTFTAYGFDANSFNNKKKQYAFFRLTSADDYARATGRSDIGAIYAHSMLSGPGTPSTSTGDDGAPVFQKFDGIWKIVGIVPEDTADTAFVRYGNVQNWLDRPAVNEFVAGFQGFIFNRRTGRCFAAQPGAGGRGVVTDAHCDGRSQDKDAQSWRLVTWGSDANSFQIVNGANGLCLALPTPFPGGRVIALPCVTPGSGSTTQRWAFTNFSTGYWRLQNAAVPGCVVPEITSFPGAGVRIDPCPTFEDTQAWVMTR